MTENTSFSFERKRDAVSASFSDCAKKTVAYLFMLVAGLVFAAMAAQAQNSTAPVPVPSFRGQQGIIYQDPLNQEKVEAKAENPVPESGVGVAPQYDNQNQGGTEDTSTSLTGVSTPAPQTNAKQPQPDQPVPHPVIQPISTIYGNPMLNHWGPPKYPLPFQVYGLHNPEPNKDALNPATFKNASYQTGAHPSDMVAHAGTITAAERTAHQLINPSLQSAQAAYQAGTQQGADAAGGAGSAEFGSNTQTYRQSLINVANELAGSPTAPDNPHKTLEQAIWMVQQMFKGVFLPMAILFLLPGAVISQMMVTVRHTFTPNMNESAPDVDTISPFSGIMRAIIALFLIPATQLIVSYSIDVGNSMTYEVTQFINADLVSNWEKQLILAHPIPAGANQKQINDAQQAETTMNATMRMAFSSINTLLNSGIMVLLAYQVVIACYLLLMGPIAAALFAWPGGVGKLFKPVFGNWLEALFNLVLWRFWWCVILLCMSTRIQWLQETGSYNPTSQWESITYLAFMAMLTYVPFMALDFKTDSMVDQLLEKTGGSGGSDKQGAKGSGQNQARPRTT